MTSTSSQTLTTLEQAKARARRIKILLFDVDGVLTDGGIWLFPNHSGAEVTLPGAEKHDGAGYGFQSATMIEAKGFHAHDGSGISLARLGGMRCGIITKRVSETVRLRARDLRLEFVYMGQAYKMQAVEEIMAQTGVSLEEIAFVGDDIIDLPVLRRCGFAAAVANARPQVKAVAHYVTELSGGHGAGREVVEFILEAKGLLDEVIDAYIDERNPVATSIGLDSMDKGEGTARG